MISANTKYKNKQNRELCYQVNQVKLEVAKLEQIALNLKAGNFYRTWKVYNLIKRILGINKYYGMYKHIKRKKIKESYSTKHEPDVNHESDSLIQYRNNLEMEIRRLTGSKLYWIWQKSLKAKRKIIKLIRKEIYQKIYNPTRNITNPVQETISVVIPTLNAGDEWKDNLQSIVNQTNINNLEIIIVDNNSSDDTVNIAKNLGCKILTITDFSHSKSRNLGAKIATGKYIIFTVQDAYFPDKDSFCKLINFMKINKLAAASGYQIPRDDAEPFAQWQLLRHYDFMNPSQENIIYQGSALKKAFNVFDFLEKRRVLLLDDVFSCFSNQIFKKYYFSDEIKFAEDAELAIKLLHSNFSIGAGLFSKVKHSHNRSFIYHFKRTFSDLKALNKILNVNLERIYSNFVENSYIILHLMVLIELQEKNNKVNWDAIYKQLKKHQTTNYQKSLFYTSIKELLSTIHFEDKQLHNLKDVDLFKRDITTLWNIYIEYLQKNNFKQNKDDYLKISAIVLAGYLGEIVTKIEATDVRDNFDYLCKNV